MSILLLALCLMAGVCARASADGPTYTRDLRPILQARCVVCHNRDSVANAAVSGGLALDTYAALQKGVVAKTGAQAIYTPGKSGDSELIRRLMATSPTKMMPRGGPPLPPAQIALFRKWIDAGAPSGGPVKGEAAAPPARPSPASLRMPADPAAQDVRIRTLIKPTADLLRRDTPKDALLAVALKIGPLPALTAIAYSPDGQRLAVGGYRAVTVWDTAAGRPVGCLTHLAGTVQSLAFRPDGTQLAVAGGAPPDAPEVRVYDAKTLKPVGPALTGHADIVYCVAWSSDGTRIATGGQDKTARLWEWPSGKILQTFRDHSDAVTWVCFAPDGKSLYTASQDHNVRRFDTANGQVLRAFSGHEQAVTALAVSPDGHGLVSSGPEPRLRWWNLDNGDTARYGDGHEGPVNAIAFDKNGKFLASASADRTVRLWDAGSGEHQRALEGADDWVYAVAIRPDGKLVAAAGGDGIVRLWEAATGRLRLSLLAWPPDDASQPPEWAAITPEGYFDASPAWAALPRPVLAGTAVTSPRIARAVQQLYDAKRVAAAWQAAALDPATLPEPPPPAKAAHAAASGSTKPVK